MQKKQGIGWQRIVRKEGVMKSTDDSPSLWDIGRCLLSSVDFAEDFSLNHPEHTDAVTRFLQEIRRITKELTSSCGGVRPHHRCPTSWSGARARGGWPPLWPNGILKRAAFSPGSRRV